jgi:hypothetical protein
MKRSVASILLLIFVLNVFGYYGVFMGVRFQAAQKIRDSFDIDNYQRGAEVTIAVPLTVPYASDMQDYQRVDGEFDYHGDVFRLVKQKLSKDTLYIVCIRDTQANKIDKALEDYVKTFTDGPISEKSQSKSAPTVSKDYFSSIIEIEMTQSGWEHSIQWCHIQAGKVSSFQERVIQPPQA